MAKGIVYIVRNPAFSHLIKIGYTTKSSVEDRGLNASNVPEDYEVLFAYECENPKEIEEHLHKTFDMFRHYTTTGRQTEFFYIGCVPPAKKTLELLTKAQNIALEVQETIEEQRGEAEGYDETKAIDANRERAKNVFEKLKLPIGSELVFIKDETKKCKVVEPSSSNKSKRIEYNGQIYSISGLAEKLLKDEGYDWVSARGIAWFSYNGEVLIDRLARLEAESLGDS